MKSNDNGHWSSLLSFAFLGIATLNCSSPAGTDVSTALTADLSRHYCHGAGRGTAACASTTGSTSGTTTGSTGSTASTISTGSTGSSASAATPAAAAAPSQADGIATIQFKNNCGYAVDVSGSASASQFAGGAYVTLAAGASIDHDLGADGSSYPALRYFGRRTGTDPGAGNFTLAEFTLNSSFRNLDYYDVSLVDAFNLPMRIEALGASCPAPTCSPDLLTQCPSSGQLVSGGQVVSCTKHGDVNSASNAEAQLFHAQCPDAYAYSTDDQGTKACNAQDYLVTFCP